MNFTQSLNFYFLIILLKFHNQIIDIVGGLVGDSSNHWIINQVRIVDIPLVASHTLVNGEVHAVGDLGKGDAGLVVFGGVVIVLASFAGVHSPYFIILVAIGDRGGDCDTGIVFQEKSCAAHLTSRNIVAHAVGDGGGYLSAVACSGVREKISGTNHTFSSWVNHCAVFLGWLLDWIWLLVKVILF